MRASTVVARVAARYLEARSAPSSVMELAKKYGRMLGVTELPKIVIKDNLGSGWLGRCIFRKGQQNVMELQKSILFDETTTERVVAHEMAHHAEYLVLTESDLALLKLGIRPAEHGDVWKGFADKINSVMGANFVTRSSDTSYAMPTETTKSYFILIQDFGGRLGYETGVRITAKMQVFIDRKVAEYGAKLIKTTDPRWANGPRIGDGRFGIPPSPEDQEKMRKLFSEA